LPIAALELEAPDAVEDACVVEVTDPVEVADAEPEAE